MDNEGNVFSAQDKKVLVVDDNLINLKVFVRLLQKTNVNIDTAVSGDEALVLTAKNKYDIIFLDHLMPGKDGVQTLLEIKSQEDSDNLFTPVVCLTASDKADAREEFISKGFDDFLTKPVNFNNLIEMMKKLMQ